MFNQFKLKSKLEDNIITVELLQTDLIVNMNAKRLLRPEIELLEDNIHGNNTHINRINDEAIDNKEGWQQTEDKLARYQNSNVRLNSRVEVLKSREAKIDQNIAQTLNIINTLKELGPLSSLKVQSRLSPRAEVKEDSSSKDDKQVNACLNLLSM